MDGWLDGLTDQVLICVLQSCTVNNMVTCLWLVAQWSMLPINSRNATHHRECLYVRCWNLRLFRTQCSRLSSSSHSTCCRRYWIWTVTLWQRLIREFDLTANRWQPRKEATWCESREKNHCFTKVAFHSCFVIPLSKFDAYTNCVCNNENIIISTWSYEM